MYFRVISSVLLGAFLLSGAYAQEQGAVKSSAYSAGGMLDKISTFVGGAAGNIDGRASETMSAGFFIPVSGFWHVQLGGAVGDVGKHQLHGSAAQLFWRDFDKGLLGVVVEHVEVGDVEVNTYGVRAEKYWNRFSVGAQVGQQSGDVDGDAYFNVEGRWLPIQSLLLSAAYHQQDSLDIGTLGAEYFMPLDGLSLYANVGVGDHDYDHTLVGARYYFGGLYQRLKDYKRVMRKGTAEVYHDRPANNLGGMFAQVNSQITDSVTQTNVKVLGDSPAMSLGTLYQATSQALANAAHNATAAQRNANMIMQATTTQGVSMLYGLNTGSTAAAVQKLFGSNATTSSTTNVVNVAPYTPPPIN